MESKPVCNRNCTSLIIHFLGWKILWHLKYINQNFPVFQIIGGDGIEKKNMWSATLYVFQHRDFVFMNRDMLLYSHIYKTVHPYCGLCYWTCSMSRYPWVSLMRIMHCKIVESDQDTLSPHFGILMDSCFLMSVTSRVVDSEHSLLLNAYATLAKLITRFQLSLKIAWK